MDRLIGVPRGVLEGSVESDRISLVTRTEQTGDSQLVHRYLGPFQATKSSL